MVVCSPSRFQTTRLPELLCSIAENYMASKVKERTEDFSVNLDGKVFRFWTCRVKMELHQGRYTPFEPPNMIGRFLASVFRGIHSGRSASTAKKMIRRIAIEPLESRRLLAVTGSLSGYAYLDTHDFGVKDADEAGFAGLTVQLQSVGSQGNLGNVAGVGLVQTLSDGSYGFTGLAAGTYQIQISPSSNLNVGILSPGSAGGIVGNDEIQVTLAAGQNATDYNFAILGAQGNDPSNSVDASPMVSSATDATPTAAAAPSGYTIVANPTTIGAGQTTSAGFVFNGATTGATYNYTVSSSGGGTAVTGSGSVTSATQDVTGINVSTLSGGTLTFSVALTNSAG